MTYLNFQLFIKTQKLDQVLSTCSFLSQWDWWMHHRTYYQRMDHGDFKKPRFDSINQISHQRAGLVVCFVIIKLFLFDIKTMKLFEKSLNLALFYRLSMNGLIVLSTGGGQRGVQPVGGNCTILQLHMHTTSYRIWRSKLLTNCHINKQKRLNLIEQCGK